MMVNKVGISCVALLISLVVMGSACAADASLERQISALKVMNGFAEQYCEVPLNGGASDLSLSGGFHGEFKGLLKKLANIGIQVTPKYQSAKWQGALQKDIAGLVREKLRCKIEVLKYLQDKLLEPVSPKSGEGSNKYGLSSKTYARLLYTTDRQTKTIEALVGQLGEKDKTIKERDEKIDSLTTQYAELKAAYEKAVRQKPLSKQDKENIQIAKEKLDNGDLEGAKVKLSGIAAVASVGALKISTTSAPFKVCKNQTVKNSGIIISVQSIKLENNSSYAYVTVSAPGKKDKQFSAVESGSCLSYDDYSIRLKSISPDFACAEFIVSNNEKPCE
jgi:hypothetical protein